MGTLKQNIPSQRKKYYTREPPFRNNKFATLEELSKIEGVTKHNFIV